MLLPERLFQKRVTVVALAVTPVMVALIALAPLPGTSAQPPTSPAPARLPTRVSEHDVVPLGEAPVNPENPTSAVKVTLGKRLFFDPILSGSNKQSCASCHQPEHGFADTRRLSLGDDGKTVARNTPSLLNVAYSPFLFWDGRTGSLEAQALLPVVNPAEMNQSPDVLMQELESAGYNAAFAEAFGDPKITTVRIGDALACYERSLTLADTRLDRWLKGDKTALSYEAIRGLLVFTGDKARCADCHGGANLTRARANNSASFVRIGVRPLPGDPADGGLAQVPGQKIPMEQLYARTGAFRIPALRGIAQTAPYMHNGSLPTLEAVVDFYDRGGDDGLLTPIGLTPEEKRYLLAFLNEGLSR